MVAILLGGYDIRCFQKLVDCCTHSHVSTLVSQTVMRISNLFFLHAVTSDQAQSGSRLGPHRYLVYINGPGSKVITSFTFPTGLKRARLWKVVSWVARCHEFHHLAGSLLLACNFNKVSRFAICGCY